MELERGKGLALWRQIQKTLEQDILDGLFPPGEKLPPERLLAERFAVNRHTLRQALNNLVRKELVRAEQGRGYFVREDMVHYALARRVRFRENLSRQHREAAEELLGWELVQAERRTAEHLMVRPGTPLVRMRTVGKADGQCLCVTSHYFPQQRFPDINRIYGSTGSITATFRHFGITDYTRVQTLIT
ncbi:MAG: phosphonate metabolism transcriptional regulator PhnF, partial [Halodesulfovibrio sp.]